MAVIYCCFLPPTITMLAAATTKGKNDGWMVADGGWKVPSAD